MLKREITFKTYDDEPRDVTKTYYFNITPRELVLLEFDVKGGYRKWIQTIIEAENEKIMMEQIERVILMSYGVRSADGEEFEKSDELRERFKNSAAYNALFQELMTDDKAAASFINGIMPPELVAKMAEVNQETGTPA